MLEKHSKTVFLSYYTILHCLVDFCCIYYMSCFVASPYSSYNIGDWLFFVIMYNFIAFAGQLPVGIIGDFLQRNHYMTLAGLGLLFCAYAGSLFGLPGFFAVLLLGTGNACFHVGGGREAMDYRENACQPVGIFVSTGAFGVFGGKWIAGRGFNWLIPMTIVLAAVIVLEVVLIRKAPEKNPVKKEFSFRSEQGGCSVFLALCCILVVVLRSLAGTVFRFPWQAGWLALLMTVGVILGKALGGVLADRFGIRRVAVVSLLCSAALFFGANTVPVMGLLAVFLFNMTMPITLSLLGMHFPHAKGTMFGALTFAIFAGLIPSYFCNISKYSQTWIYVLLAAASLLLLIVPLQVLRRSKCGVSK